MPYATTDDGVKLYYEEVGSGTPIVFVHEFAADHRSWEAQMRFFGQRHRCITYGARGYPPSDVPGSVDAYSQATAADDAVAVLDGLGIDKAHIVGLSMGGFCTLHVGLRTPERALSLTVAGAGSGWRGTTRQKGHLEELEALATAIREGGRWPIPLEEQLRAMRIAFAVEAAIRGA